MNKNYKIYWCDKCGKVRIFNQCYNQCPICGSPITEEKEKELDPTILFDWCEQCQKLVRVVSHGIICPICGGTS